MEILLAMVRGDGAAQVKAKVTAQQTAKNAEVRSKLVDLEKAKDDPTRFKEVLADIQNALKKSDV